MSIGRQFRMVWTGDEDPQTASAALLPARLAWACTQVLPVAGAGISAFSSDFRVPLGASDDTASHAERLQFTLGEGPCLHAHAGPDAVRSTGAQIEQRWPLMYDELNLHTPYRSIVSLPLHLSDDTSGALDLYLTQSTSADVLDLDPAAVVADTIVEALDFSDTATFSAHRPGPPWLYGPESAHRMQMWVAIGLLTARLGLAGNDALAVLRGYAYSHDRLVDDIADDLIDGLLPAADLRP